MCVCSCVHLLSTHVEAKGQPGGANALLPCRCGRHPDWHHVGHPDSPEIAQLEVRSRPDYHGRSVTTITDTPQCPQQFTP